ncbi:hypothetical protein F2P81_009611 [Scophthalmus maximus]|uniref:Heat shock 70 kDa protein 12B n=1 Tax=Scophthalmus maximus TaxID=52904 RepID=A0A6A4SZI8_SCOMX|nr:hypothetical protein F2P81_009611 [Scophthalmus maximus]
MSQENRVRVEVRPRMACPFSVVVAIDFGTTSSGYAFSFTQDSEAIHMMKRWEGGDPGVANQKSPTCLLLTPDLRFHSFGFAARDFYHDVDPEEARHWLYFDKFKMKIHSTSDLTMETELEAVNGRRVRAIEVFAHALRFFREHALKNLDKKPVQSFDLAKHELENNWKADFIGSVQRNGKTRNRLVLRTFDSDLYSRTCSKRQELKGIFLSFLSCSVRSVSP